LSHTSASIIGGLIIAGLTLHLAAPWAGPRTFG
jgi:hypothetical protein